MKEFLIFPNAAIRRILLGTPTGRKHMRIFIETNEHILVFHEAVVSNLVRAFVTVKTHPQKAAVELVQHESDHFRPGFARVQLLEEPGNPQEILDAAFAELEIPNQKSAS